MDSYPMAADRNPEAPRMRPAISMAQNEHPLYATPGRRLARI